MRIRPNDAILDLGAGAGPNACLTARYLGDQGRIVGLDIGTEMSEQTWHRGQHFPIVAFEKKRVEDVRLLGAEKQREVWKMDTKIDRVKDLERQIEELKRRWPAHSVPPTMVQQLEELEEELEEELKKIAVGEADAKADGRD